jgi:hypothetical protein
VSALATSWAPALDGDPGAGDPAGIHALARYHHDLADDLLDRQRHAHHAAALLTGQHGKTVDAVGDRATRLARVFAHVAADAREVGNVLDRYALEVSELAVAATRARGDADDAVQSAERARFVVMGAGGAPGSAGWWDPAPSSLEGAGDPWAQEHWTRALADFEDARTRFAGLVLRREELDRRTATLLRAHDVRADLGRHTGHADTPAGIASLVGALTGDAALVTAAGLAALGDPEAVRELWDELPKAVRDRLLRDGHRIVGNLDGIPLGVRARANRANIEDEIARLRAEITSTRGDLVALLASLGPEPPQDGPQWRDGPSEADLRARIDADTAAIAYYRSLLDADTTYFDAHDDKRTRTGSVVVTFEPSQHAIAIYHGALDANGDIPAWVRSVGVYVPGTGTKMTAFGGTDLRGDRLYRAVSLHGTGSFITWSGGYQPQLADAAITKYADEMGPRLASFVNALRTPSGSRTTVLGHSYGGTTVATAEKDGMTGADRILYVSSAGLGHGVASIGGFADASVPHYSMMVRNDGVVGGVQDPPDVTVPGLAKLGHGASALEDPAVVRLETGYIDADHPEKGVLEDLSMNDAHSAPFTPGSTAWNNIVGVVTGGTVLPYAPDTDLHEYDYFGVGAHWGTAGDTVAGWDDPARTIQVG